jgi:hypothetical protein
VSNKSRIDYFYIKFAIEFVLLIDFGNFKEWWLIIYTLPGVLAIHHTVRNRFGQDHQDREAV